ncbi:MAG TPA: retropepsin-like aspartic protease [Gemmataceae bacterium]|nr:retropepsin-like aspartic protease [Gemmataceae bacterium]
MIPRLLVWPVAWRSLTTAGVVVAALLLLPGCQRGNEPQSLGPWTGGTARIPLYVLHGRGGTTLAMVKVHINGQGPFSFVLDTGASTSGVDETIAEALQLPRAGRPVEVAGVAEVTRRRPVRIENWRVGEQPLPPHTLVTLDMPDEGSNVPLQGLLGSDVLNQFGIIRIDYERGVLIVPARQETMVTAPRGRIARVALAWPG